MRFLSLLVVVSTTLPIVALNLFNKKTDDPDSDDFLAAVQAGPPKTDDVVAKKVEEASKKKYEEVKEFSKMLPFRPRGMPYESFKQSCMGFVQGLMKRASYNPDRLPLVMPKCQWEKPLCDSLLKSLQDSMKGADFPKHMDVQVPEEDGKPAVATGIPFEKETEVPLVPEGVDDNVAGVFSTCKKNGGSEEECKTQAEAAGKEVALMTVMRAESDRGRLEEGSVKEHDLFKWCDVLYNGLKERTLEKTVKEISEEKVKKEEESAEKGSEGEKKEEGAEEGQSEE